MALNSGYDTHSTVLSDLAYHTNTTSMSSHDDTSSWSTFNAPDEQDITPASDPGYLTDSHFSLPSVQDSIESDISQDDMHAVEE